MIKIEFHTMKYDKVMCSSLFKLLMLLVVVLFVNNTVIANGGVPAITNYPPTSYGAGMQNSDVLQDRRGVYFMANN